MDETHRAPKSSCHPESSSSLPLSWTAVFCALLSSSCCVIQLALNALSFSCAGFSVLTPYRAHFASLAVALHTLRMWSPARPGGPVGFRWRSLAPLVLSALLMASPEVVAFFNTHDIQPIRGGLPSPWSLWTPTALGWRPLWAPTPTEPQARVQVHSPFSIAPERPEGDDAEESRNPVSPKGKRHEEQRIQLPESKRQQICWIYKFAVQGIQCEGCANRLKTGLYQKLQRRSRQALDQTLSASASASASALMESVRIDIDQVRVLFAESTVTVQTRTGWIKTPPSQLEDSEWEERLDQWVVDAVVEATAEIEFRYVVAAMGKLGCA
ncbi:uncharacterized protein BJ171DRAFT_514427 [Polychytrium aggregatum]|uniref:uncharacterized protein n=1 Tax=Polychytrium aggregatum TaxID=110093 RepID=UPI0022FDE42B|nr:uncharacterized protein BJ171DRAFT_514427 [Polychytrium aggregatum]KAI9202499.1 hypothetical protein BJ171DRAFT_514427 [Polychytrium aggregatum]